ncbi:MAG: Ribosomal RNA small subunit methyltransferase G [Firmicutes bacterium ADurb.Bin193]|nr:MAG: Ribosomal RNA small subunit methyltransferase G [Firmicutes bacterium ADurb.Bin193]
MEEKFKLYRELLLSWNEKMNLTAITDPDEIWTKHFSDSLSCAPFIPNGASVVDVGTGAGFPGLPLKIARPDIKLTLMDSLSKRIRFLEEVISRLDADARCVHIRAEDAGRKPEFREVFDIAVSRAVANMTILAEYCLPLVKIGGLMLAMKGSNIEEELQNASDLIGKLGGKVLRIHRYTIEGTDIAHSIVIIEKTEKTPSQYPRSTKKILK